MMIQLDDALCRSDWNQWTGDNHNCKQWWPSWMMHYAGQTESSELVKIVQCFVECRLCIDGIWCVHFNIFYIQHPYKCANVLFEASIDGQISTVWLLTVPVVAWQMDPGLCSAGSMRPQWDKVQIEWLYPIPSSGWLHIHALICVKKRGPMCQQCAIKVSLIDESTWCWVGFSGSLFETALKCDNVV